MKVNEIREFKGTKLKCIPAQSRNSCVGCYFAEARISCSIREGLGSCHAVFRQDSTSIVFSKNI